MRQAVIATEGLTFVSGGGEPGPRFSVAPCGAPSINATHPELAPGAVFCLRFAAVIVTTREVAATRDTVTLVHR
jgi:hypothetical protein